jgi:hypothetical protein
MLDWGLAFSEAVADFVSDKGRNHTVEQEAPFDADEVITKASEWADELENSGLPKGWSRTP